MKRILFLILAVSTAVVLTACVDDGGGDGAFEKKITHFDVIIDDNTGGLYAGIPYDVSYDIRANYDIDNVSFLSISSNGVCSYTTDVNPNGGGYFIKTIKPQTNACNITAVVVDKNDPFVKKQITATVKATKNISNQLLTAPSYNRYEFPLVDIPVTHFYDTTTVDNSVQSLYDSLTPTVCLANHTPELHIAGVSSGSGECKMSMQVTKRAGGTAITELSLNIVPEPTPITTITIDIDTDSGDVIDRLDDEDFEVNVPFALTGAVTYEWIVENRCGTFERNNSRKVEFHSTFRAMNDCKVKAIVKDSYGTYMAEKRFTVK